MISLNKDSLYANRMNEINHSSPDAGEKEVKDTQDNSAFIAKHEQEIDTRLSRFVIGVYLVSSLTSTNAHKD